MHQRVAGFRAVSFRELRDNPRTFGSLGLRERVDYPLCDLALAFWKRLDECLRGLRSGHM
jgi:hypothetical protein